MGKFLINMDLFQGIGAFLKSEDIKIIIIGVLATISLGITAYKKFNR